MSLKHHLLAAAYHPLRIANILHHQVKGQPSGRLRVLLYHGISPQEEERFAAQLRWLLRYWRFVNPQQFTAMLAGEENVNEDSLLLTFDDGFASNRRVVKNILNPMKIPALFFVISNFVNLSKQDDWRSFVTQNIFPGMKSMDVPAHWQNMTWDDLSYLLETGHSIGGHTMNHARLSQVASTELDAEIIGGADILEKRLCVEVEHFAYTFGDLRSFSPAALEVARSRFKYIFTGLRGDNASGVNSWAIRRDAMAATDSFSLMGALLEGGADRFYASSRAEYDSWGRLVCPT